MPDEAAPPGGTEDQGDTDDVIVLNEQNLRGIAHPVRGRLLGKLRKDGPSTATKLASELGLNSGATSYHLRQLEHYGFIVEDAAVGTARERWWRAAHRMTRLEPSELGSEEAGDLVDAYSRSVAAEYAEAFQRALDEGPTLPEPWRDAGMFSDFMLRLTVEELTQFNQDFLELVMSYRQHDAADPPDGSAPVTVQIQTFPRPGTVPPSEE